MSLKRCKLIRCSAEKQPSEQVLIGGIQEFGHFEIWEVAFVRSLNIEILDIGKAARYWALAIYLCLQPSVFCVHR